ncbi:MAG: hypothetical protein KBB55_03440 [Candidatus Buchananbacteria bacterium]|nr:hypothetical protein [Candidatus Buchananbacteria bacterium]
MKYAFIIVALVLGTVLVAPIHVWAAEDEEECSVDCGDSLVVASGSSIYRRLYNISGINILPQDRNADSFVWAIGCYDRLVAASKAQNGTSLAIVTAAAVVTTPTSGLSCQLLP